MRIVQWTDRYGYKRESLVRDEDADDMAPQGIPQGPPTLDELDWELIKRDIHNALVSRRLFTWRDVQEQGDALRGAIITGTKRHFVDLYRRAEK